mmetsp:Transcript_129210/g.401877  ORF Transcript_129210/g.401877 Transcript_129210/m.401877 type:complete len:296 (+) Transcript_129210:240-1127(+)
MSSSAWPNFSRAGSMYGVWKAPDILRILACMALAWSQSSLSTKMALSVPAQEKPLGKSTFAIWQMQLPPIFFLACSQSSSSIGLSRPAIESTACLPSSAASCMAWPLIFTSLNPSSKLKTPAAHSAGYSPKERPAVAVKRSPCSGLSFLSFTKPAMPATNMAGWQNRVCSSFVSGPWRHSSRTSQPRISLALVSMETTSGWFATLLIILTYWEPWPGKRMATGRRDKPAPILGVVATTSSSSSRSSGSAPVPYFIGSKPMRSAAPGRLEKKPLTGFVPNSQQSYCLELLASPNGM